MTTALGAEHLSGPDDRVRYSKHSLWGANEGRRRVGGEGKDPRRKSGAWGTQGTKIVMTILGVENRSGADDRLRHALILQLEGE